MSYSQLNTTSAFTFGKSTVLPTEYAKRARELGYSSIAFSDKNCYGFPELSDACQKEGIKPVFGYRISLSSGRSFPLEACLYVLNEQGYHNLCLLLSEKPELCGTNILKQYQSGLALVIDCNTEDYFDETFLTAISPDLLAYQKIFKDNFYLGVSIYSAIDKEQVPALYEFIDRNGYKSLAFPKAEYIHKADAGKTYLLRKAMSKETVSSIPEGGPYFLLSIKAIEALYREKEVRGTDELTDKVDFTFFTKRGGLIEETDADNTLERLAMKGLNLKFDPIPSEYLMRLSQELKVIRDMHFSSYFLIVLDYVSFCRKAGIKVGPGRGSAGGALVSYCLGITSVDPIRYHLSFERFLNPKRKNMPDIDIDFEDDRRNEVITYLKNRYGPSRTADIVTFSTLKPRSALNLIGPALGFNSARLKKLSKVIDAQAKTFEEALECKVGRLGERLREMISDPYYKDICEKASSLTGLPINTSIHASGIIVADDDIYKNVPMANGKSGTALFEYPTMERLGYLKLDILALNYLTFLKEIEQRILKQHSSLPDIENNLNDPETYQTLNSLDVADIFQLEKTGMQRTISTIHPDHFQDLAALLALFRPGPKAYIPTYARRKEGKEAIAYEDERLKPILEETYGIMIYQEQVIEAVKVLAGFSAGDADLFRRAISKKDLSKMEAYAQRFKEGCLKNGIPEAKATKIYEDIEKFADYGFNKSHAYSYTLISYRLLYYKTHYPEAFYAAAFHRNSITDETTQNLMKELKKKGILLKNPDINLSKKEDLCFLDKKALLPLSIVRLSDLNLMEKIVKERENGPFTSFYDFTNRLSSQLTEKDIKGIDALIDAGAFDAFCPSREEMQNKLQDYLEFARLGFNANQVTPLSSEEEDIGQRLQHEKSSIGIILSQKLAEVVHKQGYLTLIATDTSDMEMHHSFIGENEINSYHIELKTKTEIPKNGFVLVKADDFSWSWIRPTDFIVVGRKVKHHV